MYNLTENLRSKSEVLKRLMKVCVQPSVMVMFCGVFVYVN